MARRSLSTDDKPQTVMKMITEREDKLMALQARLASMKTAPQVLDLEARRMGGRRLDCALSTYGPS